MTEPSLALAYEVALLLAHGVAAGVASAHALLNKRDPRSATAWILVCWLFPLAGPVFYYLIGINRTLPFSRHAATLLDAAPSAAVQPLPHAPGVGPQELRELIRIGDAMTGRPLSDGNAVHALYDADDSYPAMLAAIADARHTICLSTYIYQMGQSGHAFATALTAAQDRGVSVRLLIDGIGDLYYRPRASKALSRLGLRVARFLPPRLLPPMLHINLRNHRKLLIVDGRVAFLGGMNIGDYHYRGHPRATSDLHFQVTGPVVAQLAGVFHQDWFDATGEALPASATAPAAGQTLCRAVTSGPDEDMDKLSLLMLAALATAHQRVAIMTPYFIPSQELSAALQSAALRGVDVSIVLPERSNLPWVDWATRHALPYLLTRQVRLYLQPPPFAHSKLFLIDDYYALIGSANLDPRSLRLNFELMLETYDPDLVAELSAHFETARTHSQELTLATLRAASLPTRLRNAFCWLFSPNL